MIHQFCNISDLNCKANASNLSGNYNPIRSISWESIAIYCVDMACPGLPNPRRRVINEQGGRVVVHGYMGGASCATVQRPRLLGMPQYLACFVLIHDNTRTRAINGQWGLMEINGD